MKWLLTLSLCFCTLWATDVFAQIEESGCSPTLEHAALEGDVEVVELLLEYGADVKSCSSLFDEVSYLADNASLSIWPRQFYNRIWKVRGLLRKAGASYYLYRPPPSSPPNFYADPLYHRRFPRSSANPCHGLFASSIPHC